GRNGVTGCNAEYGYSQPANEAQDNCPASQISKSSKRKSDRGSASIGSLRWPPSTLPASMDESINHEDVPENWTGASPAVTTGQRDKTTV
ncbi:MAG TPA: hypothetical protein VMI06_15905, partial [Terriglobia bacterium]|nr:hypothetical protein [Terriglobia bacterium]